MSEQMNIGVFIPIGNNGWLISKNAPQYMPTFELNKQITQKAESYGFDFALSMIKLRGFGGETEFWEHNLESFTLMAGLAAVTSKIQLFATAATLTMPPAIVARMASTMSSAAAATVEPTPLVTSTVLVSSSLVREKRSSSIAGASSSRSSGARPARSPVARSASMSSHSKPTEERADAAKPSVMASVSHAPSRVGSIATSRDANQDAPISISSTPPAIATTPNPMSQVNGSSNRIFASTAVSATPVADQMP